MECWDVLSVDEWTESYILPLLYHILINKFIISLFIACPIMFNYPTCDMASVLNVRVWIAQCSIDNDDGNIHVH